MTPVLTKGPCAVVSSWTDASEYRLALVPFIALPKSGGPYVFCAIPYDSASNPGQTIERLLP
jgi:hypothetical protein